MNLDKKRARRRAQYRRSREDPNWVEHYRARKRDWAQRNKKVAGAPVTQDAPAKNSMPLDAGVTAGYE